MATWIRAWFRVDRGGFLADFSMARNMISVHGLIGNGPLHLSTMAWVADDRRSAASSTAFSSALALAESGAGGAGTWISLPDDSTQVFHVPAVRSACVTAAMASPPSSPHATMPALTATHARPATLVRQRRDRVERPPNPITFVPPVSGQHPSVARRA
jgi:hypothetical protein